LWEFGEPTTPHYQKCFISLGQMVYVITVEFPAGHMTDNVRDHQLRAKVLVCFV
jgi:hypothetical protein